MTIKYSGPKLPAGVSATPKRKADGTVVWYFYHKETRTRLLTEPGTTAFEREAARAGRTEPEVIRPLTLNDLCDEFEDSPEHKGCALATRSKREFNLIAIRKKWGHYPVARLSDRHFRGEIISWRNSMSDFPGKADQAVHTIQRVLSWAYDSVKIDYNHGQRIGRLSKKRPRAGRGITEKQEAALLACARPHERWIYLMALYTTIRQADLARLRWRDLDDEGWLTWGHTKTKGSSNAIGFYPVFALPAFKSLIEELPETCEHMLTTTRGKRWASGASIRLLWGRWLVRAGLDKEDIHFHDIKREGINRLLRAGCTDSEVSSISGHTLGQGSALGEYADRCRELALSAYTKLAAHMNKPKADPKIIPFGRQKKWSVG